MHTKFTRHKSPALSFPSFPPSSLPHWWLINISLRPLLIKTKNITHSHRLCPTDSGRYRPQTRNSRSSNCTFLRFVDLFQRRTYLTTYSSHRSTCFCARQKAFTNFADCNCGIMSKATPRASHSGSSEARSGLFVSDLKAT